MTDADILRLSEPFLSMRDAAQPTIRGKEDLIAFARAVEAASRPKVHAIDISSISYQFPSFPLWNGMVR